ncbi:hypothetical protein SUGI_0373290 [Cryptomeria japonica]|uniref:UDP-glycosyltransferase 86A1 n=1 Tax=Cryptomeria japonica TaxID=3369 RepID=UPI002408AAC8|nr:UDP-glycosyltransferase 86A1 [Cryptomeria japonica]GLJ20507.1 hypothetical protein SUGI_0373290 [Cryptomeria japonica]
MAAHAVVVPYPGRGHVNPMMQFALKLASHGIPVTVVVTKSWHKILTQADQNPFTHVPEIRAAVIPDCVVGESERWANMEAFLQSLSNMEAHVAQLLTNLNLSGTPATCIVADVFLKWVVPFAKRQALRSVLMCPMSVTSFSVFYHLQFGIQGWKDFIARSPPLQQTDLPADCMPPSPLGNFLAEGIANTRQSDWIVANSLYALDCNAVEAQRQKTPVQCVGPFIMGSSSQLDTHCSEWLDSKPAGSVIYVSFGSFMTVARDQIREIATGLMKSGCYFLWALRPDKEASHFSEMLPTGFLEECKGQGLIAAWFMQAEVLKHPAVGGFMSHCGWNAVMESVSAGVPMLGFPLTVDQFMNCRMMLEEWKFGLGLKNAEDGNRVIRGGEIESKVKMLMKGEEGVSARRAAERFRGVAEEEVSKGGRSAINLEILVNRLKAI